MAIYNISTVKGGWIDKKSVKSGTKAKLVSETNPMPSNFTNEDGSVQTQDVAQILLQGEQEPKNIKVNKASIAALAEAFGPDSAKWIGHTLTLEVEKTQFGGKRGVIVYLVPEGYEVKEDLAGYVHVQKITDEGMPVINLDEPPAEEPIGNW